MTVPPPVRRDPVAAGEVPIACLPDEDLEDAEHDLSVDPIESGKKSKMPPKQQIFDNEYVTQLCRQWKQNEDFDTYKKICAATNNLIDAIIRVHKFHRQAPFEDIKNFLFLQFRNWLRGVKLHPGAPKVYTYLSSCIKNGALSYIGKEKQLQDRMIFANDTPLDAFKGTDYVQNFDFELRQAMLDSLHGLELRWNEPVIREVIKYLVREIMDSRAGARRQQILRTVVLAYPITMDTAKFLLDWTQAAIRAALLQYYDQPLGEIDIMRIADKFSFIPDIVDCIGLENAKKLMTVFAGVTIRFPSHTQLRKYPVYRKILAAMEKDPSPDSVGSLANHLRTSPEKVRQHYEMLQHNVGAGLLTNSPLYGADDDMPTQMTAEAFHS